MRVQEGNGSTEPFPVNFDANLPVPSRIGKLERWQKVESSRSMGPRDLGPSSRSWIAVVGPRPGLPVHGLVVNEQPVCVWTHYLPNPARMDKCQTAPHVNPPNLCPGCLLARPKRWKAYLGAWDLRYNRPFLAEITADAARSCAELLHPQAQLRGLLIELERKGKQRNSPVFARLAPPARQYEIPSPLDTTAQLLRLWGLSATGLREQGAWIDWQGDGAYRPDEKGGSDQC